MDFVSAHTLRVGGHNRKIQTYCYLKFLIATLPDLNFNFDGTKEYSD